MARMRFTGWMLAALAAAGPAAADEFVGILKSVSTDGDSFVVEKPRSDDEMRFRGAIDASVDGIIQSLSEGARIKVIFDQVGNDLVVLSVEPQ